MSLQYLNGTLLGGAPDAPGLLTCAWDTNLGTDQDPANGEYYTSGPNGDGGLYGGLTDSAPTNLDLNQDASGYVPLSMVGATSTVDNLTGTTSLTTTVTLTPTYVTTVEDTHTTTQTVSAGAEFSVNVAQTVMSGPVKFSINYTWSSTQTTGTSTSTSVGFAQEVDVTVPPGKIYEAQLVFTQQQLTIPYSVDISVTGNTYTWFADRVDGHYNYSWDAGTAFGYINQYGCAGSESAAYSNQGNGVGVVTLTGTLVAGQYGDFDVQIIDVTNPSGNGGDSAVASAPVVVKRIPLVTANSRGSFAHR